MLTPKQICETLEISPSTLRRWANQYLTLEEHEPGQHRTYTPNDLTTLQTVKTLLANGLTRNAIKSRLAVLDQPEPTTEPNPSTALLALPEFQMAIENARATIASMQTEIEELQRFKTEFQEWANRPFWQRIFRKPPTE
jgi:DNA-binding transcriptional MerR regulator